jgi:hypothetical protein
VNSSNGSPHVESDCAEGAATPGPGDDAVLAIWASVETPAVDTRAVVFTPEAIPTEVNRKKVIRAAVAKLAICTASPLRRGPFHTAALVLVIVSSISVGAAAPFNNGDRGGI